MGSHTALCYSFVPQIDTGPFRVVQGFHSADPRAMTLPALTSMRRDPARNLTAATERPAAAGSLQSLKTAYQRADVETMLRVVVEPRALRG